MQTPAQRRPPRAVAASPTTSKSFAASMLRSPSRTTGWSWTRTIDGRALDVHAASAAMAGSRTRTVVPPPGPPRRAGRRRLLDALRACPAKPNAGPGGRVGARHRRRATSRTFPSPRRSASSRRAAPGVLADVGQRLLRDAQQHDVDAPTRARAGVAADGGSPARALSPTRRSPRRPGPRAAPPPGRPGAVRPPERAGLGQVLPAGRPRASELPRPRAVLVAPRDGLGPASRCW